MSARMIRKLLVANRGEVAVRIIRAAKETGARTVAVYSEADREALHVKLADQAVCIGPPEPSQSYLRADRILDAARSTGAEAIHPGYGFLSERAEFSEACGLAGLTFVGPSAGAMRRLGAKIDAKKLAVEAGVPVTTGHFEPGATAADLKRAAERIGYPVMLKASGGGGGRGMRIVRDAADFDEELRIASDEALQGFGDGAMMVEKLIVRPRHLEVQVLAVGHGNAAALFERECSLQRRHQKLVEEAASLVLASHPCPFPRLASQSGVQGGEARSAESIVRRSELWPRLREAALSLVRASGYTNAGTVEFMFDEASGEFYFLEVNARLQVEHPVTEAVTGLDLVQWQLRIAAGEPLDLPTDLMEGNRSALRGHAIEARIVAEDPARGFLPSTGKILAWAEPRAPGVRVDTGYGPGAEVSRYYDSLLAKVIAHGETRPQAIARLRGALLDFHVLGVRTNIAYLLDVLAHPDFLAGRFDTGWLGREFAEWAPSAEVPAELGAIVAAASAAELATGTSAERKSVWDLADGFRNARGS